MKQKHKQTLEQAIALFGFDNQLCKLMEECGELIQAANKYRMQPTLEYRLNLLMELSDVQVMIEQAKIIAAVGNFDDLVDEKIKRLQKKLRSHEKADGEQYFTETYGE